MQIREIMSTDVDLVSPDTTVRDAAIRMRDNDIGALPVGENDRLVGMVTDRDIAVRAVASDKAPGSCTVREVMSEGVYYAFDNDEAAIAADTMAAHQLRRLPIVNRDKNLVGVVALADLARAGIAARTIAEVSEPSGSARK